MSAKTQIIDYRLPNWIATAEDWERWRLTYNGGQAFVVRYLEKFSTREEETDFAIRKRVTPIPGFAKAAINDVRNSIFQRMKDITRHGGSKSYQNAMAGLNGGVDRRGATMNSLLGIKILTELLVMGKVGVYVDSPKLLDSPTLSEAKDIQPYLYCYQIEDILSYSYVSEDSPSEFKAVLLRDSVMEYDQSTMLPIQVVERYRRLWLEGGYVWIQYYSADNQEIDVPIQLNLTRIPFVLLDLGDSLIKDVCQHQIALLNLTSSDVAYALLSNFPFYVKQADPRTQGQHLKTNTNTGTATTGGQGAANDDIKVGVTHGQLYPPYMNQPNFINPSSEPLEASMKLQENLKNDIRSLINLAVQTLATRGSAESKSLDNQGLEAGLSYIGLILENAERKIAEFWAAYETKIKSKRQIPTIKYPDRYSLKTDGDRIEESTKLCSLMTKVPGPTVKREIAKSIVEALLGGKVSVDMIGKINTEIDNTKYTTSDPDTILQAVEAGLCSEQTGSMALGFDADEHEQARKDHAQRIARVAAAQTSSAGARGLNDLSFEPDEAELEKQKAAKQRGDGKKIETQYKGK